MKIEKITSPSGIPAWLVREQTVPLVTLSYAFHGGSSQDEADKPGTANLAAEMLDEGAGDLDGKTFHERLENHAIELGFRTGRDNFHGSLRALNEHREEAFDLLRLALTAPRFEADAVERVRGQVLSALRRDTTNPNTIASEQWWAVAFPGHPYGREGKGTLASLPRITADDLRDYVRRIFARNELTIAIVGDVDAKTAGELIDRAFATLPAKNDLKPVAAANPSGLGRRIVINLDVPQAVVTFGGKGLARNDPDFMAAYIVNHILAGGSFTSRLYREVREKRGLAYGVSDSLVWLKGAAVVIGGTATRADRTGDALAIIEAETKRMAEEGPTAEELAAAKSFLKGSYALSLDTSSKIAVQLTQIQLDNLGIDYIQRRGAMIDAVTIEDAKRVAKRLFGGGMLVTVAGQPKGADLEPEPSNRRRFGRCVVPATLGKCVHGHRPIHRQRAREKRRAAWRFRRGAERGAGARRSGARHLRARHADGSLPLLRLPEQTNDLAGIRDAAAKLSTGASDIVILGTGGSSLGGQTLAQLAFYAVPGVGALRAAPRLHFIDNLDPVSFEAMLAKLPLATTRFVAISKSGGTAETLMQTIACLSALKKAGLDARKLHSSASASRRARASATACATCWPSITCRCSITIRMSAAVSRRSPMSACCRRRCSASTSPPSAKAQAPHSRRCWRKNPRRKCRPRSVPRCRSRSPKAKARASA